METIWTLGTFAVLSDGQTFCVTSGDPEDFTRADILTVVPTKRDALRAIAYHASKRYQAAA